MLWLPHHAPLVNIETPNTLILGISWLQIAHADEYPTMHHFGIPRPTQWIAYTCIFIQDWDWAFLVFQNCIVEMLLKCPINWYSCKRQNNRFSRENFEGILLRIRFSYLSLDFIYNRPGTISNIIASRQHLNYRRFPLQFHFMYRICLQNMNTTNNHYSKISIVNFIFMVTLSPSVQYSLTINYLQYKAQKLSRFSYFFT